MSQAVATQSSTSSQDGLLTVDIPGSVVSPPTPPKTPHGRNAVSQSRTACDYRIPAIGKFTNLRFFSKSNRWQVLTLVSPLMQVKPWTATTRSQFRLLWTSSTPKSSISISPWISQGHATAMRVLCPRYQIVATTPTPTPVRATITSTTLCNPAIISIPPTIRLLAGLVLNAVGWNLIDSLQPLFHLLFSSSLSFILSIHYNYCFTCTLPRWVID